MEKRKSIKTDTCALINWHETYMCLRANEQLDFKEKVKKACEWRSDALFSHKKNGNRGLSPSEQRKIKKIFKGHGIGVTNELQVNELNHEQEHKHSA